MLKYAKTPISLAFQTKYVDRLITGTMHYQNVQVNLTGYTVYLLGFLFFGGVDLIISFIIF